MRRGSPLKMKRRDPLYRFDVGLARETEAGPRKRIEPLRRDRLTASLTTPVGMVLQLLQRRVDVVNQSRSVIEPLDSNITVG